MLIAMLMMLAVPILTFAFLYPALRTVYWIKGSRSKHRIPYHIYKRIKLIEYLCYAWFAELILFFWLAENWPFFMSWWD